MKIFFPFAVALSSLLTYVNAVASDTQCQRAMCVTGIMHNNATTEYTLTVTEPTVGWMAIGFGSSMITSPLVILWKNTVTGDTVVSQRRASDFVMPTVDPNPNLVATALNYRAASNSSSSTLSFSVPSTTETVQTIIWAWSKTRPSGNTPGSNIVQHDDQGGMTLSMNDGSAGSSSTPTPYGNAEVTLTPSMKVFIAHAVFLTLGFMVILPLGALQARLFRTIVPGKWWFRAHWILQWPVTTVLIIIGFSLGVSEVNKIHTGQFNTTHKRWGLVLVCLYVVQCSLGGIIHFIKSAKPTRRPPQNYGHATLGILIIALSFWQVYTGMDEEWLRIGGNPVPMVFWTWWKVWTVMIPLLYLCGLALLPRQYRLERDQRENRSQLPFVISAPKLQTRLGDA